VSEAFSKMLAEILRRGVEGAPAHALGVRSAAFPVEERLDAVVEAAVQLTRRGASGRGCKVIIGSFAAPALRREEGVTVAPPEQAAALATAARNTPHEASLIYLSSASPAGEAGLADLFELTGADVAASFAKEAELPLLAAIAGASARRVRDRLAATTVEGLWRYREAAERRDEVFAAPLLELLPEDLRAEQRVTDAWARGWDALIGTKASNKLQAAERALTGAERREELDARLRELKLAPSDLRGSPTLHVAALAKASAAYADGRGAPEELMGLTRKLLALLKKGDKVVAALLSDSDSIINGDAKILFEEDALHELQHLKLTRVDLDERELHLQPLDGEEVIVRSRRHDGWVCKLAAELNETFWREAGACGVRASGILEDPRGGAQPLALITNERAPLAPLRAELSLLQDALDAFLIARHVLAAAIRGILPEGQGDGDFQVDTLRFAELFPLATYLRCRVQADDYIHTYSRLLQTLREHAKDLSEGPRTWALNLDIAYARPQQLVEAARMLPLHPLRLARAQLWCQLGAPTPALPEILCFNGSGRPLELDRLSAQEGGLYLSGERAQPSLEALAAAARAGLRQLWRALSQHGMTAALSVEFVDISQPALVIEALAEELTELFNQDTRGGAGAHLEISLASSRAGSRPAGEIALEGLDTLLLAAPGDGPSLRVNREHTKLDPEHPVSLRVTPLLASFSPRSAVDGPTSGLRLVYEVGAAGHIASVQLAERSALDDHEEFLRALGSGGATPGLSAPGAPPRAAGALAHVVVARGGWPFNPREPNEELFAYQQDGDHFTATFMSRALQDGLLNVAAARLAAHPTTPITLPALTSTALQRLYDLREIIPKALDPSFEPIKLRGDLGKLRVFEAVTARSSQDLLIFNLDAPEGLRWARALGGRWGSQRRADLLLIERDATTKHVERVRVAELKTKSRYPTLAERAALAAQAQLTAARLRACFSAGADAALQEGLRAVLWLGAGAQRQALAWKATLQHLDALLEARDAPPIEAECWIILDNGQELIEELAALPARDVSGDLVEGEQEDVRFFLLAPPIEPAAAPAEPGADDSDAPEVTPEAAPAAPSPAAEPPPTLVEVTARRSLAPAVSVRRAEPPPSTPLPTRRGLLDMEARYKEILALFREFREDARRPSDEVPYHEGPGFYVVRFVPGPGVKASALQRHAENLKLRLGLGVEQEPRTYIDRGAVVFEIPKRDEERYFVDIDALLARAEVPADALYAPLGEDMRGELIGINFSSSDSPHLLIAGTTGSGKSIALESLLYGICRTKAPEEVRLFLVDPKGTDLIDFEGAPHLGRSPAQGSGVLDGEIGIDAADAIELLAAAVDEMQRRLAAFRVVRARSLQDYNAQAASGARLPWWLLVLDEYADLTADKDERKEIEALLQRLAQKARSSGIHLIIATQKPSGEVISTTIRSNLPAQLALRVKTVADSRIIIDEGGAESLAGKGDAFFKTGRGAIRLQCASLSPSARAAWISK
jgi:hypothetical protein